MKNFKFFSGSEAIKDNAVHMVFLWVVLALVLYMVIYNFINYEKELFEGFRLRMELADPRLQLLDAEEADPYDYPMLRFSDAEEIVPENTALQRNNNGGQHEQPQSANQNNEAAVGAIANDVAGSQDSQLNKNGDEKETQRERQVRFSEGKVEIVETEPADVSVVSVEMETAEISKLEDQLNLSMENLTHENDDEEEPKSESFSNLKRDHSIESFRRRRLEGGSQTKLKAMKEKKSNTGLEVPLNEGHDNDVVKEAEQKKPNVAKDNNGAEKTAAAK